MRSRWLHRPQNQWIREINDRAEENMDYVSRGFAHKAEAIRYMGDTSLVYPTHPLKTSSQKNYISGIK
jgi:hypothetical protein